MCKEDKCIHIETVKTEHGKMLIHYEYKIVYHNGMFKQKIMRNYKPFLIEWIPNMNNGGPAEMLSFINSEEIEWDKYLEEDIEIPFFFM
jgi:hypothetical protein